MLSPLDYAIWALISTLELGVLYCAVRTRSFLLFFPLNFYMLVAFVCDVARFFILHHYGFGSRSYHYFYYYSDALLTICLFFALTGLYSRVFKEMGAAFYVRLGAIVVLILTAAVCFTMVRHSHHRLTASRFASELSQNLHFVGAVLTYLLWSAVKKLRETRTRLIQFTLALGVYFSAFAASFALAVLYPGSPYSGFATYAMGLWLPLAWAYTFLKIPENARLQTARVASGARS
jgi:hypothetical protein